MSLGTLIYNGLGSYWGSQKSYDTKCADPLLRKIPADVNYAARYQIALQGGVRIA